ncbi:hypothetical protein T4D_14307 [Trichinella pseudospiralis]|uniref:Uncharacterized protein n=1 Tax=Trichinella pseudospiralis TaxID=6337 RepID=A0A0V1G225_TRIPS|nr:hypothetical protein T4D_14307 [Trichinella pseudospiralis]
MAELKAECSPLMAGELNGLRRICICGLRVIPLSWNAGVDVVSGVVAFNCLRNPGCKFFWPICDAGSLGSSDNGGQLQGQDQATQTQTKHCALVTPNSLEAGTEKITEGEPDMGNGDLEEWGGSLVDRAECSLQGKRTLRGVLLRCRKANSRDVAIRSNRPASGVWSSPVVLVQKKDVSHQFCVDNCKLIEYRILRIDDTLDALPRLKWFSTLDLASGSASCTSRLDREEDTATMQVTGTRGQPMDKEPMRPARHNRPAGEDYMSLAEHPGDPYGQAQPTNLGGGQFSVTKALVKVRQPFFWPQQQEIVEASMQLQLVIHSFQRVAMDFVQPLEETRSGAHGGNGTSEQRFLPLQDSRRLHSEGQNFKSVLVKEVCQLFFMTKTQATAYYQQLDGLVVQMNHTLLDMLAKVSIDHPVDWDAYLGLVLLAYQRKINAQPEPFPAVLCSEKSWGCQWT